MKKLIPILLLTLLPVICSGVEAYVATADGAKLMHIESPIPKNGTVVYPAPAWAKAFPEKYLKIVDGKLLEKTEEEKASADDVEITALTTANITNITIFAQAATNFTTVTFPIEIEDAITKMHTEIATARGEGNVTKWMLLMESMKLCDVQYEKFLKPAGIDGEILAKCIQKLQELQQ